MSRKLRIKANGIATGTVIFTLFLMLGCLQLALNYAGARHYFCGTPAVMIEETVAYELPLAVAVPFLGWRLVRYAPLAASVARGAALTSLTAWLSVLAFIKFGN